MGRNRLDSTSRCVIPMSVRAAHNFPVPIIIASHLSHGEQMCCHGDIASLISRVK